GGGQQRWVDPVQPARIRPIDHCTQLPGADHQSLQAGGLASLGGASRAVSLPRNARPRPSRAAMTMPATAIGPIEDMETGTPDDCPDAPGAAMVKNLMVTLLMLCRPSTLSLMKTFRSVSRSRSWAPGRS